MKKKVYLIINFNFKVIILINKSFFLNFKLKHNQNYLIYTILNRIK